jgi:hypothetical protein
MTVMQFLVSSSQHTDRTELDALGFECWQVKDIFLFPKMPRQAIGTIQPCAGLSAGTLAMM